MEQEYKDNLKRWNETGLRIKCDKFVSQNIQEECEEDFLTLNQHALSNNSFEGTHKVTLLLATPAAFTVDFACRTSVSATRKDLEFFDRDERFKCHNLFCGLDRL